jgi:hypothetical protein
VERKPGVDFPLHEYSKRIEKKLGQTQNHTFSSERKTKGVYCKWIIGSKYGTKGKLNMVMIHYYH